MRFGNMPMQRGNAWQFTSGCSLDRHILYRTNLCVDMLRSNLPANTSRTNLNIDVAQKHMLPSCFKNPAGTLPPPSNSSHERTDEL